MRWVLGFLLTLSLFVSEAGSQVGYPERLSYLDESYFRSRPVFVWGKDPFERPAGFSFGAPTDKLKLEAVIYSRGNSSAMVNGKIVQVGSKVSGGATVTEIGSDYIVIHEGTALRELVLENIDRGTASGDDDVPDQSEE